MSAEERYLDLLKRTLTRTIVAKTRERQTLRVGRPTLRALHALIKSVVGPLNLELVRVINTSSDDYLESGDAALNRVEDAETMLGTKQLDQMQAAVMDVVHAGVPGDLLEAGVWRGGMSVFMRGVLATLGVADRSVWVVDSFEGLPAPTAGTDTFGWEAGEMAASLEEVTANFARYGLLDAQVHFLKGYFCDSLPTAPIGKLAVFRLDADLYESTRDALIHLYPRLSAGGYAIFDDYTNLPDCRRAIEEYRTEHGITDAIVKIDRRAVYWKKLA